MSEEDEEKEKQKQEEKEEEEEEEEKENMEEEEKVVEKRIGRQRRKSEDEKENKEVRRCRKKRRRRRRIRIAVGSRAKTLHIFLSPEEVRGTLRASTPFRSRIDADRRTATHDGHGVGREQLLGRHGGEVGDVGERVHEGDQRDGDVDGTR